MKNTFTMMLCSVVLVSAPSIHAKVADCPASLATKEYILLVAPCAKVGVMGLVDGFRIQGNLNLSEKNLSDLYRAVDKELSGAQCISSEAKQCLYTTPRGNQFVAKPH